MYIRIVINVTLLNALLAQQPFIGQHKIIYVLCVHRNFPTATLAISDNALLAQSDTLFKTEPANFAVISTQIVSIATLRSALHVKALIF